MEKDIINDNPTKKKRSVGVTIMGVMLIVWASFEILGLLNFKEYVANCLRFETGLMGYIKIVYGVIGTIAGLIAGIYILKLRNWARKLIIALGIIAICFTAWEIYRDSSNQRSIKDLRIFLEEKMDEEMDAIVQKSVEKLKPEYQEEHIQKQKTMINTIVEFIPIFYYVALAVIFLWNLLIIFFFTRPKVKEQFKQ